MNALVYLKKCNLLDIRTIHALVSLESNNANKRSFIHILHHKDIIFFQNIYHSRYYQFMFHAAAALSQSICKKKINGTQTVIHVHVPLIDRLTIDHEQKKPIYIVGISLLQ